MNFDRFRIYTKARIGLGHEAPALPTKAWLLFSLHHADAIDALTIPWRLDKQEKELLKAGFKTMRLGTKITDRAQYMQRPDLGRQLNDASKEQLMALDQASPRSILITASNGLSSLAVKNHLTLFLRALLPLFDKEKLKLSYNRIFLIPNGRVALIDDIGEIVNPILGLSIIGERPGLSSPDSLAAYLTYAPRLGRSDSERNCISNIRPPHGLSYEEAAAKLIFLIKEAMRRKLSGVTLKDLSSMPSLGFPKA